MKKVKVKNRTGKTTSVIEQSSGKFPIWFDDSEMVEFVDKKDVQFIKRGIGKCKCNPPYCTGWSEDSRLICEKCNGQIDTSSNITAVNKLEDKTERNMEVVNSFMEHYKKETGNKIDESIFLSFFNA